MAKKISFCALFSVLALAVSYFERLIPPLVALPGIKLGLANIVVLTAVYLFGARYALMISLTRIGLSALLFGDLNSLFYSLCGGLLSFAVICLLFRTGLFGFVGISAAGGVAHNAGQLFAAWIFLSSKAVWGYFPVLLLSGAFTGIATGIVAYFLTDRLEPLLKPVDKPRQKE